MSLTANDVRDIVNKELAQQEFVKTLVAYPEVSIYVLEKMKTETTNVDDLAAIHVYINALEEIIANRPTLWKKIKSWFTQDSSVK